MTKTISIPTSISSTGSVFTGIASGGWNATSSGNGVVSSPSNVLTGTGTGYAAPSGFQSGIYGFPTSAPSVSAATSPDGVLTIPSSSYVSSHFNSTGVSTAYTIASPPYVNSTAVSIVSSAQGVVGTISSTSRNSLTKFSSVSTSSGDVSTGYSVTTAPYINSTSVITLHGTVQTTNSLSTTIPVLSSPTLVPTNSDDGVLTSSSSQRNKSDRSRRRACNSSGNIDTRSGSRV